MENRAKGLFVPNYKNQTLKTYLLDQIEGGVHNMSWDMTQFIAFLLHKYENTNTVLDWEKEFLLYIEKESYEAEQNYLQDDN